MAVDRRLLANAELSHECDQVRSDSLLGILEQPRSLQMREISFQPRVMVQGSTVYGPKDGINADFRRKYKNNPRVIRVGPRRKTKGLRHGLARDIYASAQDGGRAGYGRGAGSGR